MTRSVAFALSGLLAFTGLSQAQYDTGNGPQRNYQRLINSRYRSDDESRASRMPSRGHVPQESMSGEPNDPEFAPLAFIQRTFVNTLGREPSEQESAYWMRRLAYQTREGMVLELRQVRPLGWMGNYDPRLGKDYDPGVGSSRFPDPASLNFRDPSGPYFKSPYFSNYQYRRPMRAFPLGSQG
ncbi:MAG TPA: hypothetical protein VH643_36525 [Gemmataceae bacterium]|jgi:hypothetical protein